MNNLGKVRIGKVKSVSNELVSKYPTAFSTDFDVNKKLIYQYTDIRSKHLNNRVAGYVTRLLVSQKKREEALKLEEAELASQQTAEAPVMEGTTQENIPSTPEAEGTAEAAQKEESEAEKIEGEVEGKGEETTEDSSEEQSAAESDAVEDVEETVEGKTETPPS